MERPPCKRVNHLPLCPIMDHRITNKVKIDVHAFVFEKMSNFEKH